VTEPSLSLLNESKHVVGGATKPPWIAGSSSSGSWHLGRVVAAGFYRFPTLRTTEAERCQVGYTTRSKNVTIILIAPPR
jgi:hypothetical protein